MLNFGRNDLVDNMLVKQLNKMLKRDKASVMAMVQQLIGKFDELDDEEMATTMTTLDNLKKVAEKNKCDAVLELVEQVKQKMN